MTHRIRIRESFADAVYDGRKTFEVRFNDCGYQSGDTVEFKVVDDSDSCENPTHPLNRARYDITYVLPGWGLREGFVAFGIKPSGDGHPQMRVNL